MRPLRGIASRWVNRLVLPVAPWLPTFGVLTTIGRRSGRTYRTPINTFRRGDHFYFALTYGSEVDWVKNAIAAGGCELLTRGVAFRLVEPEVFVDPELRFLPQPARFIERLNRATEGVRMRVAGPASA